MTFRKVVLPLAVPGIVAGSIFTFSLTLGDYIVARLVGKGTFIGNGIDALNLTNRPLAATIARAPAHRHLRLSRACSANRRVRGTVDGIAGRFVGSCGSSAARCSCSCTCRSSSSCSTPSRRVRPRRWPPQLFTLKWFTTAWHNPQIPPALKNSILVGIVATVIALTLGTLASFAMAPRPVLRSRHDLVRARAADRASRDRDRAGAVLDGRRDARPELRDPGDHRRARDVLRGRRVQQRGGAAAPDRRARSSRPRWISAPTGSPRSAT